MKTADISNSGLVDRIKDLVELCEQRERGLLKAFNLGIKDFEVLKIAHQQQAPYLISPNQILKRVSITSGALSTCLGRLADKHLILRLKAKHDQRSRPIQLTTKGRQLVEQLQPDFEEQYEQIFAGLKSAEKQKLIHLLEAIITR